RRRIQGVRGESFRPDLSGRGHARHERLRTMRKIAQVSGQQNDASRVCHEFDGLRQPGSFGLERRQRFDRQTFSAERVGGKVGNEIRQLICAVLSPNEHGNSAANGTCVPFITPSGKSSGLFCSRWSWRAFLPRCTWRAHRKSMPPTLCCKSSKRNKRW